MQNKKLNILIKHLEKVTGKKITLKEKQPIDSLPEPKDAASNQDVKLKQAIVQRYKELASEGNKSSIIKTLANEFKHYLEFEEIVELLGKVKI